MRRKFWNRRMSEMVAIGLSIVMILNPIAASAEGMDGITSESEENALSGNSSVTDGDGSTENPTVSYSDASSGDLNVNPKPLNKIFPDKYLAIAVAASLGINDMTAEVTQDKLDRVYSLTIDTVMDWTGVEKLTNMYSVTLQPSSTYDIANLEGLENAPTSQLHLLMDGYTGARIQGDIAILSKLQNLTSITVDQTYIYGELSSLGKLYKLTSLSIMQNDLTPPMTIVEPSEVVTESLDDMTNLSITQYDNTTERITGSLEDISNLTSLMNLNIDSENINGTLKNLEKLLKLEVLYIRSGSISGNLSDINDLLSIKNLEIRINNLEGSYQDLSKMKGLVELNLKGNNIQGTLKSLEANQSLYRLTLYGYMTYNLNELPNLPNLRHLHLEGNLTGTINGIVNCPNLEELHLSPYALQDGNLIGNISALQYLKNIENLNISNFPLLTGDIADIANLGNLRLLTLSNTGIEGDLKDISTLHLDSLYIDKTNVKGDISALSGMISLYVLDLSQTVITGDIGDLSNLNSLYSLRIYETNVTGDLSEFGLKTMLYELLLSGTPVRIKPSDSNLFPNLSMYTAFDMFTEPHLDKNKSTMVYNRNSSNNQTIELVTNKSPEGFAKLIVDDTMVDVSNYTFNNHSSMRFDDTSQLYFPDPSSGLQLQSTFLDTLSAGTHDFTLDFYWGGEVRGAFTITESTQHIVTFHDYNGAVLKTQTVPHGGDAAAPDAPVREGYTFKGWDISFTDVMQSLMVTAVYESIIPSGKYTVTFLDYDGDKLDGDDLYKQTVEYGKPAKIPTDPERPGYHFICWDRGFAYITEDVTITAKYQENNDTRHIIEDGDKVYDLDAYAEYGNIFVRAERVTLNGSFNGNIYVEAENALLNNISIDGSVFITASGSGTKVSNSVINGSLIISAESIMLENLKISGNVSIGATDTTFQSGWIGGNLTIEKTVADGHVTIIGVVARDTIVSVRSGGDNSIVITDSILGAIVVDKPITAGKETVRVAVQGTTEVANVIVNSAAIIEDTTTADATGIQNVTLSNEIPANTTVELRGAIKEVTVQKEALTLVNNATVEKIQVEAPSLTLVNNATVSELKVEENVTDTKVEGVKIENVVVADGTELPVYVERPQTGTDSGNDDDMDGALHTFLPKGADGEANPYGKVSVYDDVLLANGVKAKARLLPVSEAVKKAADEFAKTQDTPNTPFAYVDVVVDGYKSGKVTVKFNLYDIYENDDILVFHQKTDGTWESIIPDKIENGAVTVTFNSLSPVVFSKATDAAGNAKVTSPKTSDNGVAAMAVLCVLGNCAGLCYLQFNRRRYRR